MMAIYKYIFSLVTFFILVTPLFSQDTEPEKEPWKITGIKAGMDIGRFSSYLFKPEQTSYAGSIDIGFNNKYYAVFEYGYSEINLEKDTYNYYSNGTFWKVGLDYNMLKKYPTDFLGVGFRFAQTSFEHFADDITISYDHWGNYTTSTPVVSHNAIWLEASLGVKGELFKNVYFGWSALIKVRVNGGKDSVFQPYDIPGFGNAANTINLGANYFIYYQIPFNRK